MTLTRLFVSLSILLLSVSIASAQEQRTFFSPGLKFGYEWGHGLFAGIELSYTIMPRDAYAFTYGASLNFDLMRDGAWKAHLGAQGGHAVGVQIGPTYYKEKDAEGRLGYSFTAFSLVTLMPYYTYTDLFGKKINESGVLLKIPLQTSGPKVGDLFKT